MNFLNSWIVILVGVIVPVAVVAAMLLALAL